MDRARSSLPDTGDLATRRRRLGLALGSWPECRRRLPKDHQVLPALTARSGPAIPTSPIGRIPGSFTAQALLISVQWDSGQTRAKSFYGIAVLL
jgi:hypothetical protein